MEPIDLGDKVRDKISGFEGVATARIAYLGDSPDVRITGTALHDGKPVGAEWFSDWRVEKVTD